MSGLRDLDGLQTITRATRIEFYLNTMLESALALQNAAYDQLYMKDNPKLVCVPHQWPLRDTFHPVGEASRLIRAGPCPCTEGVMRARGLYLLWNQLYCIHSEAQLQRGVTARQSEGGDDLDRFLGCFLTNF